MTELPLKHLAALVQLDLPSPFHPYPLDKEVSRKVLAISGTSVKSIESEIDQALSSESDLTSFVTDLHQRRSNRFTRLIADWDDVTFYGSVYDEMLRSERNKLRLSLLSSVIPQQHLVHATAIGPWIPAAILESQHPPSDLLQALTKEFCQNIRRALSDVCFEHVGLLGFLELGKFFGQNVDGHDFAMASDWYRRRGEIYWGTNEPTWPQYALHAHLIGFAVRFQRFAELSEIDGAFDRRFPERWSVLVKQWDQSNSANQNVTGLGNYVWKIGPHRRRNPATSFPPAEEVRANARFWNAVGHHHRNFDVHGYWPEAGPRILPMFSHQPLTKLDRYRRQLAWDIGLRIWTADDLDADVQEPTVQGWTEN